MPDSLHPGFATGVFLSTGNPWIVNMLFDAFRRIIDSWNRDDAVAHAWIVGFSGGVDSCVLLDLCCRYRDEVDSGQVIVGAHLDHCLRGRESELDADFCRNHCERRNVIFAYRRIDVRELSASTGMGLEEAGRAARHDYFAGLSRQYAASWVLLAHHADDQAETVLFNILRGSGLGGLCGMAEHTRIAGKERGCGFVVRRPLLQISKQEIMDYAGERNLAWREDRSNQETTFSRNRIRHELLPLLERMRPNVRTRLLVTSGAARSALETIGILAQEHYADNCEKTPGGVKVPVTYNGKVLPAVIMETVRLVCELDLGLPGLRASGYAAVQRLLNDRGIARSVDLTPRVRIRREQDFLFISALDADECAVVGGELVLPEKNAFSLVWSGFRVVCRIHEVEGPQDIPAADRTNPEVEWLACGALQPPLVLRARSPGERMQPLGAPGSKKIKDILIDRKVPKHERDRVLVLADAAGPVWLHPVCVAHRVRVKAAVKKALRVLITPCRE